MTDKRISKKTHRDACTGCLSRLNTDSTSLATSFGVSMEFTKKKKQFNRSQVGKMFTVMKTTMRQGLVLRGHKEHDLEHDNGKLLETMRLVSSCDVQTYEWLCNGSGNTLHTSPTMHNDVMQMVGKK